MLSGQTVVLASIACAKSLLGLLLPGQAHRKFLLLSDGFNNFLSIIEIMADTHSSFGDHINVIGRFFGKINKLIPFKLKKLMLLSHRFNLVGTKDMI
jgi:hypothetical protein